MPTPIKTRFFSIMLMIKMISKYRKVVQTCSGSQSSLNLHERVPAISTRQTFKVTCGTLDQLFSSCFKIEERNWAVVDAVSYVISIYIKHTDMACLSDLSHRTILMDSWSCLKERRRNLSVRVLSLSWSLKIHAALCYITALHCF